jgi:hypothetical protein
MQNYNMLDPLLPLVATSALADGMKPPINAAQPKWAPRTKVAQTQSFPATSQKRDST